MSAKDNPPIVRYVHKQHEEVCKIHAICAALTLPFPASTRQQTCLSGLLEWRSKGAVFKQYAARQTCPGHVTMIEKLLMYYMAAGGGPCCAQWQPASFTEVAALQGSNIHASQPASAPIHGGPSSGSGCPSPASVSC